MTRWETQLLWKEYILDIKKYKEENQVLAYVSK